MPKNMHAIERPLRVLIGVVLLGVGGYLLSSTWLGLALIALSVVPFATAAVNSCPAYTLLGVSTAGDADPT
jgi:uncharacterized membrane protein YccC